MNTTAAGSLPVQSTASTHGLERLDPTNTLVLTVCTLGVFAFYKFYRTVEAYRALAAAESRFQIFFAGYFGSLIAAFLARWPMMLPWSLAMLAIVMSVAALEEALKLRKAMVAKLGLQVTLHDDEHLRALWVAGFVFSPILVGSLAFLLQGFWLLTDHNRIVDELERSRASA